MMAVHRSPSLVCRRGSIALLLALALVIQAPGPAPAAAGADLVIGPADGVIAPLLGLNIGPHGNVDNPDLTEAYQARGIRLIRTHDYYGPLDMSRMYPDRSRDPASEASFDFTGVFGAEGLSSDETFASILDGGFEPYFRLGDSYNDVAAPSSSEVDNWVQASVQVLRHYRVGQWDGFSSNFRFVEIWNEPNGLLFWPLTAREYVELYVKAAFAIRSALPDLAVGGPALNPAGCLTTTGREWTVAFLDAVRDAGAPLDFFSWHMYSNDPEDYTACAAFYRAELDRHGFATVPQHVSEWNTENASGAEGLSLRALARGAAVNTAAWIAMQQAGIAQETFYRGPEPAEDFPQFYGMFYADGRPKKVGLAAELWREMTTYETRHAVSGGAAEFYQIAGRNDDGRLAVLVANTSGAVRTWSLDEAPPPGFVYVVRTVSDEAEVVETSVTAGATFTIPAYGVQLVVVRASRRERE